MFRSQWRRVVVTLAVIVVLLLALVGLASVLVPQEQLAERIAEGLSSATGAEVTPGAASLKWAGGLGLRLTDGLIQGQGVELARRTGMGQGVESYDLRYSRLEVSLDIWALLRRQLAIKKVLLSGPKLVLQTDDGPVLLSDFSVRLTDLHLDLAGLSTAAGLAPGEQIPADLSFTVRSELGQLTVGGVNWDRLELIVEWADRRLVITKLVARLGSGQLNLTGAVDYSADPWGRADWTLHLQEVPAELLLTPFLPELATRLSCNLAGDARGNLRLRNATVCQQTLQAKGHLGAGDGVLQAADWLQDAAPYLGERQDLTTIRFERLSHDFEIKEGRYLIDKLRLAGPDTDWQAKGWLGFGGDLGVRVGVRLPVGFTPDLGGMSFLAETLRDDEGRVRLGLILSGRMAAPRFGLDFGSLRGGP